MSVQAILEGLHESRLEEAKKKEVRCPKCNSTNVDNWEKDAYYCNVCGYEFGDKELEKVNSSTDSNDLKDSCIVEGSINNNELKALESYFIKYVEKNLKISAGVSVDNNSIKVEVLNGDWKHEHILLKNKATEYFKKLGYKVNYTKDVIDGSEDDTYSAVHIFRLSK